MDQILNWKENLMSYDISRNLFVKDILFDGYKLRVVYSRLINHDDEFVIKRVYTLDGQDILDLLRDKFIERLERLVK